MRTATLTSPTRRRLLSAMVVLAALTAACGGDDGPTSPAPSPDGNNPAPSSSTGFQVTNSSDRDAYYLYTRTCGTADWGEDELGSANILYPGESVSIDETAGCYDVLALTKHELPRYQALYEGKTVTAGQVTVFSVEGANWTEITDPMIASLSVGRK